MHDLKQIVTIHYPKFNNLDIFFELIIDLYQKVSNMKIGTKPLILLMMISIACGLKVIHNQDSFTAAEMESMLQTIDSYFFSPTPIFNIEIRKFLRAAFHDCMGGCDGSIDTSKTNNRGLELFVEALTDAYNKATSPINPNYQIFRRLSRADFWVLCEERALGWGIKNSDASITYNGTTFFAGRSAASASNTGPIEANLPNAAGGWSDMLATMKKGIPALTETDIVALLGVHGSGAAQFSDSGFKGPWGPASDMNIVNNHFYITLLGLSKKTFTQTATPDTNLRTPAKGKIPYVSAPPDTNLYEWVSNGTQGTMMLPIDMQIYHSFTPNPANGYQNEGQYCPQESSQSLVDCTTKNTQSAKYLPLAKNAPLALAYARNNTLYLDSLLTAFLKIVSNTAKDQALTPFSPAWECTDNKAECLGDILFSGCAGTAPTCS